MKKLQKLLLLFVATFCVPITASFAEQKRLYLTIGGGAIWGVKAESPPSYSYQLPVRTDTTIQGRPTVTASSFISNNVNHDLNVPQAGKMGFFGVGQYFTETIRVEVLFVKPWLAKMNFNVNEVDNTVTPSSTKSYPGTVSSHINSAQVRAYMDLFEICDLCKVYAGAGIGWSQVKAKVSASGAQAVQGFSYSDSKNENNLAWMLGFGVQFDVTPDIQMAVQYSYQDFGHAKNPINTVSNIDFRGNSIAAKIMFDI